MKKYKILIIVYLFLILLCSASFAGTYVNIIRIETTSFPEVKLFFNIKTHGISGIPRLDEDNFTVLEDSKPVESFIIENLSGTDNYLNIIFAIDSSRSMSPSFFRKVKNSAHDLLKLSGPDNRVSLFSFDDEIHSLLPFTTKYKKIEKAVQNLKRKGSRTLLYNCIYDSIDTLQKVKGQRKAVIVFSDGKDEGSSVNHCDIVSLAEDSGIPVFFITTGKSEAIEINSRISDISGGRLATAENRLDMLNIYKKILSDVKGTYSLKYNSKLERDNNQHKFEIRFRYKHLRDRAIRGKTLKSRIFGQKLFDSIDPFRLKLAALVLLLVILFILSCVFLSRRERRKLTDISGEDSPLPEIKSFYETVRGPKARVPGLTDDLILSTDGDYEYTEAWLLEKNGPDGKKKYPIFWDDFTIGRDRENGLVVDDRAVSLNHARIRSINGVYYLFDLVSDNGTFLNSKKLLRPRPLYDWDEIKIGHTEFIFRGSKIPVP